MGHQPIDILNIRIKLFKVFDKPFYIIMNIAMGGTLGGDIPSNLESCKMEVDYVRVYQNK